MEEEREGGSKEEEVVLKRSARVMAVEVWEEPRVEGEEEGLEL